MQLFNFNGTTPARYKKNTLTQGWTDQSIQYINSVSEKKIVVLT